MSAFSRGLLLRHQCTFKAPRAVQFPQSKGCQQSQYLSSSSILRAVKKARTSQPSIKSGLLKAKPSTPVKASTPTSPAVYQTFASTLAQKSRPTLLYEAPSHTNYMIACYGTAGFCFVYSISCFWTNYINVPPDISAWVPFAFAGISFLMAALGGWLVLGPSRLVKTIKAVPRGVNMAQGSLAKSASVPELQIEIELKKMFPVPFFPAKKMCVRPREVTIPFRFVPQDKRASIQEARELSRQQALERQKLEDSYRGNFFTSPMRRLGTAFSKASFGLFTAMKRVWTREGMMMVEIQDQMYKVDITSGWALDGGKALDRLVRIKP
ncbi:hypothetical protein PZA11_002159 [Diplocarpon coronariae]|uniref:Uncharacterized protein n=1 Tax=Diplocarpon coronariae TaxID=2795749 RepID=A0A218ZDW7_9HELO|nr:hypothetical protein JHW43_006788 [Diplocarpon mali]OWP06188.1 hypothetical protein B2J93_827 [Marssonina coronariae]